MSKSSGVVAALFELLPSLVWSCDPAGRILEVSHAHAEQLGLDPDSVRGEAAGFVHGTSRQLWHTQFKAALDSGSAQFCGLIRHGRHDWHPARARLKRVEGGVLVVWVLDKDDRAELFNALAANLPAAVYLCRNDDTYSMLYLNDQVEQLTGWPASEFLSGRMDFVQLYHPDDVAAVEAEVTEALGAHRRFELRYRLRHRDGQWRHIEEFGLGIFDAEGALVMLEGALFDRTEKVQIDARARQLEQGLLEAQKLESLGLLAGGIAHDFNNMLMVMLTNVELAIGDLGGSGETCLLLRDALSAAESAANLTRQMLVYAGRSPADIKLLDLRELLEPSQAIAEASHRGRIEWHVDVGHVPCLVRGDGAQLQQIIMNLLINAAQALPSDGGKITARLLEAEISDRVPHQISPLEPMVEGRYVVLEVADTGQGMSKAVLGRVFDPFFTTKKTGNGLGLAAVLGGTRSHGGALSVTSEVGKGTCFRVYLPAAGGDTPAPEELPAAPLVLIVDDEPTVARAAEAAIRRDGLRTHVVLDGAEAIRVWTREAPQIAAVVMDINMPHMNGPDCLAALAKMGCDRPVIFCSGRSGPPDRPKGYTGKMAFLAKPYRPSALTQLLDRLLD